MPTQTIKYLVSESENIIMDYLWKQAEGKYFHEIMEYLAENSDKSWKKQTVNTFLLRLTGKGLLTFENTEKGKRYSPAVSYEKFRQGAAEAFLDKFSGGSVSLFLSALSGGKKIDEKIAKELRELLAE